MPGFIDKTPDYTASMDPADIQQNKTMGGLANIPFLFWLPLVSCPQSRYGRFHSNQGLLLLILSGALGIVSFILGFIPYLGWILSLLLYLGVVALTVVGLINGFSGKAKELPLIGKIRIIK